MKNIAIIFFALAGMLLAACNSGKPGSSEETPLADYVDGTLPLPAVPDSLTSPEERAAFVVLHFWDAMDWQNRSLSLDTAFMEQNFSNYISVLPYAEDGPRRHSVASLLKAASADKDAHAYLASVAEHYLADPNSPMRSEDLYIVFLEEFLRSQLFDEARKTKYEYQLEVAKKNRPGTTAADFAMTGRDGRAFTLGKAVADAQGTVVIFYDPDCEHCKEIMGDIAGWKMPEGVQVLAVDVTGDAARFAATKGNYPAEWRVAFATDPIEDDDLYVFPALPSIYLLDTSSTVLLKDASPRTVASLL